MTNIVRGPKKPVSVELSEDLVRQATRLTPNLSETVESLLAAYVEAERGRRADSEKRIERTIGLLNEHEAKYGVWGEEFSVL